MENLFDKKSTNTEEKNKILWLKLFLITSWIIVFFISLFYYNYNSFKSKIFWNEEKIIIIETWDTFKDISEKINLIPEFRLDFYLKFNKPNYELQAWKYKVVANSTINDIIKSLEEPIFEEEDIVLLEWWNIYDIDEYLTKKWLVNEWDYIDYVTNNEKIKKLSEFFSFIENLETLEWFLYPDTYTINTNWFWVNKIVIKQLENFEEKVYNKILSDLDNETIKDIVNLASIVEKEEKNPTEKATVAWILKKRLNSDWQIWADITVCYPHELTSEECKMVVSKYINEVSAYNTRTMTWLPKTPIWNPSFETIEATLNDKKTNYWFYLHNIKSWKIYYAETNAQHEANKKYMY